MRMTVANGSMYADHYGQENRDGLCEYLDQGIQRFTYAVLPYAGECPTTRITKAALALNTEEVHINETYHAGPLPQIYRGAEVSSENIIVTALKPAADGEGFILRAFEAEGRDADCLIKLPAVGAEFHTRFTKYSVKTFRITARGVVSECDFMEGANYERT
jgi:alpha-mannosidase